MERTYTIPLRREFRKAPSYKRAKKSIKAVKEYIRKHMKTDNIKICENLNQKIWERGGKRPPVKVKIQAKKEEDYVLVELQGFKFPEKVKSEEKKVKEEDKKPAEPETKEEEQKKESAKVLKEGKVQAAKPKKTIPDKKPKTIKKTGAVSATGKSA